MTVYIIHRDVPHKLGYIVSVHTTKEVAEEAMDLVQSLAGTDPMEYEVQEWEAS